MAPTSSRAVAAPAHRMRVPEPVAAAAVGLAVFLAYLPALRHGFVNWDDNVYVTRNAFIGRSGATLLRESFLGFHASNWHPATWLSHALDVALWGLAPAGHHLTNNLLHAANAFLVVLFVARLGRLATRRRGAEGGPAAPGSPELTAGIAAGLLFGIHPLHVETVAWVSQRKGLLCALFSLLSLLAYLAYASAARDPGASGRRFWRDRRYLASLGLFALALTSKPAAVSLPALLLVLDWFPCGRLGSAADLRRAVTEKAPFAMLSAASTAVAFLAQRAGAAVVPLDEIPLAVRFVVALRSLGLYLGKMLAPLQLAPFYPYPPREALTAAETLLPAALAIVATAASVAAARRGRPLWLAAWGWCVLALAPVLGIVQVGGQAMADRYAYLPSIGPFAAAGAVVAWAWGRSGTLQRGRLAFRAAWATASAMALIALTALTVRQTAAWRDSVSLWNAEIARIPAAPAFCFYNRASAYEERGQLPAAIADYGTAIALEPDDARARVNRGLLLLQVGRRGAAATDFEAACRLGDGFGCQAAKLYAPAGPAAGRGQ